jgi:hypothetical protein
MATRRGQGARLVKHTTAWLNAVDRADREGEMTALAGEGSAISADTTRAGRPRQARPWLRIFVAGYLLWVASVLVIFTTDNSASSPRSSCSAASWSRSPSGSTPSGAPTRSSRPDVYPPLESTGSDCSASLVSWRSSSTGLIEPVDVSADRQ